MHKTSRPPIRVNPDLATFGMVDKYVSSLDSRRWISSAASRTSEYESVLGFRQRCWELLWHARQAKGFEIYTMTSESGPDGHMQKLPFSREPVAHLWEVNQQIAQNEQQHCKRWQRSN